MREMDTVGLTYCNCQASIFELSTSVLACSSNMFIRRYIYSDVAKQMDRLDFNIITPDLAFEEIKSKYGDATQKQKYPPNVMYWLGYIYRYWSYIHEISILSIYKMIRPSELAGLYPAYHTLDPEMAIQRIIEAKKIKQQPNLEEAVNMYREIIKKVDAYFDKG